jgi:hypothetical protein
MGLYRSRIEFLVMLFNTVYNENVGTYKVRNEIETKPNQTKPNQRKRNETKRNQRNENEMKRNQRNQLKQNEID